MDDLTFWACVRYAWLEGGRFVQRKSFIVVVAFAALLACSAASVALSDVHRSVSSVGTSKLTQQVVTLVRFVVMTALPMQVIQYVLLGERDSTSRSMFGKEFWRYVGLAITIGLCCIAIAALWLGGGFLLAHSLRIRFPKFGFQLVVWGAIALCLAVFILTRLSLLFCHVAIGRSARWRASWNDTRGHFWRIVVSHFLTGLPIQACVIVLLAIGRTSMGAINQQALPYLFAVGLSFTSTAGLILGSTCSSWLYKQFARTLLERP
jgi:hypothetical protein